MVDTLIPFDRGTTFKREINRSLCDLQMQNIRRRKKRERERKSVFVYVCVCVCNLSAELLSYFHSRDTGESSQDVWNPMNARHCLMKTRVIIIKRGALIRIMNTILNDNGYCATKEG